MRAALQWPWQRRGTGSLIRESKFLGTLAVKSTEQEIAAIELLRSVWECGERESVDPKALYARRTRTGIYGVIQALPVPCYEKKIRYGLSLRVFYKRHDRLQYISDILRGPSFAYCNFSLRIDSRTNRVGFCSQQKRKKNATIRLMSGPLCAGCPHQQ